MDFGYWKLKKTGKCRFFCGGVALKFFRTLHLDESGDLGFNFKNRKTSKFFVITFLFTRNKRPLEKIIKNIFGGFSKNQIKSHSGVLHCYKEKPELRIKLLRSLIEKDFSIIVIYLNKRKVYTKLHDEKHVLYNYVTNILLDRIFTKMLIPLNEPITLIASRRETNKFLNQNFRQYLENQSKFNHETELSILIRTPKDEKLLQVVDFISWSYFRKIEHGDESYYNIVKSKFIEESGLFP